MQQACSHAWHAAMPGCTDRACGAGASTRNISHTAPSVCPRCHQPACLARGPARAPHAPSREHTPWSTRGHGHTCAHACTAVSIHGSSGPPHMARVSAAEPQDVRHLLQKYMSSTWPRVLSDHCVALQMTPGGMPLDTDAAHAASWPVSSSLAARSIASSLTGWRLLASKLVFGSLAPELDSWASLVVREVAVKAKEGSILTRNMRAATAS